MGRLLKKHPEMDAGQDEQEKKERHPFDISHTIDASIYTTLVGQKTPDPETVRGRTVAYIVAALIFAAVYATLPGFKWVSNVQLYILLELIATVFSLIVSVMALIKYNTRHYNKYLFIGIGFLGSVLIHWHAVLTISTIAAFGGGVDLTTHTARYWLFSQLYLSLFIIASIVVWWREKYIHIAKISKYTIASALFITFLLLSLFIDPVTGRVFHLLILVMLISAFIGSLKKQQWKWKFFEHWFLLALIGFITAELLYLSSGTAFDTLFTAAYIIKIISYSFTLVGLLMSMYVAFLEVEQARDKIDTILKSIGDGVFVVDAHGTILLMNKVAERMTGMHFPVAKGKHYKEVFHFISEENPKLPYRSFVEEVIRTGKMKELSHNTLLIRKDGMHIPISDSAAPIKDDQGHVFGCVIVFRDITREKELEKTKDNFLSIAAHQLRTPLGAMRWNMEMILNEDIGKIPSPIKQIIEQIYTSNRTMIKLVDDLLNVSRIDQRRVSDNPEEVDIAALIHSVITELASESFRRNVKVSLKTVPSKLSSVIIDPARLREVTMNLISNAIKYNRVAGSVDIHIREQDKYFTITLADTGIGIPAEDRAMLFSKFYRAQNARTSATDGTGLGLFVVKSYMEAWGGTVSYTSTLGKGTTFTIILPKKPKQQVLDTYLARHPQKISQTT
ncbi:MAG TPA: ATP-binding protein [Patescibacteria group bacterium]|nr:ATP-binding protein [Patescibacteria group bacterium]